VRGEIFAAGNGRNVVKSVLPRTSSLTLKNDVGVNAAYAARFLVVPKAQPYFTAFRSK
jgi:hypothetical protein